MMRRPAPAVRFMSRPSGRQDQRETSAKMDIMAIGIFAALLGLLIATACITIPRVVSRRNDPYSHADALAYQQQTGRSAQEIEQDNAAVRAAQADPGK